MSLQNPYILGALMVAAGLVLWLAARLVLNRLILPGPAQAGAAEKAAVDLDQPVEATLLVRHGGRLIWLNEQARKLFQLKPKDTPGLERLARCFHPEEDFLSLCARDGQAHFTLDSRSLEVESRAFQLQRETYRLITLREARPGLGLAYDDDGTQGTALQRFTRLALALSGSLDLDNALRTIGANLARLLPLDALEICLWNADTECLTAFRMTGALDAEPILGASPDRYALGEGLAGRLAAERKALLLDDPSACRKAQPSFEGSGLRIRSCMGVPLLVADELVGTLALASCSEGQYQAHDLQLLMALSAHAAAGLRNARLYTREQQRAAELNSLAQLTQAFGSIRDSQGLYTFLVESIAPLLRVDVLGFLILNESSRVLEGRAPFNGLPAQFIEMYRLPVPAGSPLEQAYLAQEVILSANGAEDPRWEELGLQPLAAAASLRETVLVPLVSGGSMLGYLQAANHSDARREFSADELRLLKILASQTAPIIENANLLQQLTLRAQRAEALRRIASLASSESPFDEILRSSLLELVRLLGADAAALFMVDRNRTSLAVRRAASWGDFNQLPDDLASLPLEDAQFPFTAAGSLHTLYSGKVLPEKPLVPFYRQLMTALQVESLVAAPLIVRGKGIAEILVCSREPESFTTSDLQVITSAAGQLAGMVDNALEDRTEELRREHRRLQTMLRVSTELSASLDIQQVLQRSLAVINEAFGAQESIILTAQGKEIFRAGEPLSGSGEGSPPADGSLERQIDRHVIHTRTPVLVDRLTEDQRWTLPAGQTLAASSLLALPLILGEEVLGSLLLLHQEPAYFQAAQIELLAAVARQIASTLKNSELFNLIRDQAEKLGGMLREQQIEASRSRAILEAVADGVVVTGGEGGITLFNASAGRILGAPAQQLAGQPLDRLDSLVGKAGEEWLGTIYAWTQDHIGVREGQTYAAQVNLDNGRVVAIHLAPVIWRASFLGTVSIFRDITHQVQVDRLKSEFITNVSHELRTPLTSIKGYADILLMGAAGVLSDQQQHFVNVVRENALRLQGLVDDLLNVSHIQAGKIVLDYQPVDLAAAAEGVAQELRALAAQEKKAIGISLDVQPGLPNAHGDPERTRQVLRGLALNSYKYTPENGEVSIRIRQNRPDELQVDVKDNGIGIPLEDQPRIFERFFRGEHPLIMATAGAGLGLALAKILVEMQDGRIWFTSSGAPGAGSVFSFTLPVDQSEG